MWHDDLNDTTGYCPACFDVAMEAIDGYEDANGIYMTFHCPSCGLFLDWKFTDDSPINIPPYEE